jgi:hypothetical protein
MQTTPLAITAAAHAGDHRFDCLAVLETTITQDCALEDDGVLINEQASGRSIAVVHSPRGLGPILPGDLRPDERTGVDDALATFVARHARGPVVLERMLDRGNAELVHVHVCLLPLDGTERADIAELLADESDPDLARRLAEQYGAEIATACAERLPGKTLPVYFLEDLASGAASGSLALPAD